MPHTHYSLLYSTACHNRCVNENVQITHTHTLTVCFAVCAREWPTHNVFVAHSTRWIVRNERLAQSSKLRTGAQTCFFDRSFSVSIHSVRGTIRVSSYPLHPCATVYAVYKPTKNKQKKTVFRARLKRRLRSPPRFHHYSFLPIGCWKGDQQIKKKNIIL